MGVYVVIHMGWQGAISNCMGARGAQWTPTNPQPYPLAKDREVTAVGYGLAA